MGLKLYEIKGNYEKILDEASYDASQNDGVVSDDLSNVLKVAFEDYGDKIESVACFIKNLLAEENAIANEIKTLTSRKKTIGNRIKWLKNYLSLNIDSKFESPKCKVSFRKSESLSYSDNFDVNDIAIELQTIKITPNAAAIKSIIKSGAVVKGVVIAENQNIQIK